MWFSSLGSRKSTQPRASLKSKWWADGCRVLSTHCLSAAKYYNSWHKGHVEYPTDHSKDPFHLCCIGSFLEALYTLKRSFLCRWHTALSFLSWIWGREALWSTKLRVCCRRTICNQSSAGKFTDATPDGKTSLIMQLLRPLALSSQFTIRNHAGVVWSIRICSTIEDIWTKTLTSSICFLRITQVLLSYVWTRHLKQIQIV